MNRFFKKMSLAILLATVGAAASLIDGYMTAALACNYYASPSGGGNGLSQSSPFRIANFWNVAAPGKTLCLMDGVYSDVIKPPEYLNGTASARITVRALSDGRVRIDGGGVRTPVQLKNNDYFVLEGFDAHNSSDSVILFGTGADYNILRRVCAWDGKMDNNVGVMGSSNPNTGNLFEDVCAFGSGRKIIGGAQGSTNHVIRRAWARWENSTSIGPKNTFSRGYNSVGQICENCIGTWDGIAANQPEAIFKNGPGGGSRGTDLNPQVYGSIAYVLSSQATNLGAMIQSSNNLTSSVFKDIVIYTEKNIKPLSLPDTPVTNGGPCTRCFATSITVVGQMAPSVGSQWQVTNRVDSPINASSSLAAAMDAAGTNPFQVAQGNGARVCKRYVNGVLTSTPLWPWPMNQRIIDAMKQAGKTPVDVTKTMEEIFGPIPSECRGSASTSSSGATIKPTAPVNLNVTTGG